MQELKKINVLSATRVMVLFGLVAGIVMTLYMWGLYTLTPTDVLASMGVQGLSFTFSAAATILLLQVVLYALIGAIGALLYNLFAKWIGGIRVELAEVKIVKKASKKK